MNSQNNSNDSESRRARPYHVAIVIVYGDPDEAQLPIVAEHLQLLRDILDRRRLQLRHCPDCWITLYLRTLPFHDPWVIPLSLKSPTLFQYYSPLLETTPCQSVASAILHQNLLQDHTFTNRFLHRIIPLSTTLSAAPSKIAILKTNQSVHHVSKRFFHLSDQVRSNLSTTANITFLAETISKPERMWRLAQSQIIVDSSGANMEINRLLLPQFWTPSHAHQNPRCWITFVHPEAEQFMQTRCNTTIIVSADLTHHYSCPQTTDLHEYHFLNAIHHACGHLET